MPKTLAEASNNINPYIGKGISKTLLTPCRRVGLSRKRKPGDGQLSSSLNTSQNSLNVSSGSINLSFKELNVAESASTQVVDKGKHEEHSDLSSTENKHTTSTVTVESESQDVKKISRVDDTALVLSNTSTKDNSSMSPKISEKRSKCDSKNKKKVTKLKSKKKQIVESLSSDDDYTDKSEQTLVVPKTKNKKGAPRLLSSDEDDWKPVKRTIDSSTGSQTLIDPPQQSLENSTTTKTAQYLSDPKNKRGAARLLSSDEEDWKPVKRSSKLTIDSSPDSQTVNDPPQQSFENVDTNNTNSTTTKTVSYSSDKIKSSKTTDKKTKKIKRSLSMKKSYSEEIDPIEQESPPKLIPFEISYGLKDCSIVLNDLKDNSSAEPPVLSREVATLNFDSEKIAELEKEVEVKRQLVENLRQAEIYRNKHKMEELKELTGKWKSGCKAALNDLLANLQKHRDIDMATLLQNLKVPEELITLSPNDDLI